MSRVLLVEDNAQVRAAMARAIGALHHDVVSVDGVATALKQLYTPFDVVVSDLHMNGPTGLDLARILRACGSDVPVLLVTGAPEMETAIDAVSAGAAAYLLKPVPTDELRRSIAEAASAHERARRARQVRQQSARQLAWDASLPTRESLNDAVTAAIGALHLHWQPIVAADTGAPLAWGAALHNDGAHLPPDIALATAAAHFGRLHEVGRAVRAQVVVDAALAPPDTDLFIPIHPFDLEDPALFDARSPMTRIAHRIVLELRDCPALDHVSEPAARMKALRDLGFRIAVEGIGTGYSGLRSVAVIAPDFAKLDVSLVRQIDRSEAQRAIVQPIIDLCVRGGIGVVAEGVQTAGERDCLRAMGCNVQQGCLFAAEGSSAAAFTH